MKSNQGDALDQNGASQACDRNAKSQKLFLGRARLVNTGIEFHQVSWRSLEMEGMIFAHFVQYILQLLKHLPRTIVKRQGVQLFQTLSDSFLMLGFHARPELSVDIGPYISVLHVLVFYSKFMIYTIPVVQVQINLLWWATFVDF